MPNALVIVALLWGIAAAALFVQQPLRDIMLLLGLAGLVGEWYAWKRFRRGE